MRQRPDYGVDGPIAVTILFLLGGGLLGAVAALSGSGVPRPYGIGPRVGVALLGADLLAIAGGLLWYSRVGKGRLRGWLLDRIPWRGDESVLDVGCGRGLLLVEAARRLTTGMATGIDPWRADLSGNRPGAAIENARLEGVADRVTVMHGDARRLPFADHAFDVVLSALVLHNIRDREGREQAVREIARVLKPGGHVLLLDLRYTADYARLLRRAGVDDVRRSAVWRACSPAFRLVSWGAVHPCWVAGGKAPASPRAAVARADDGAIVGGG